METSKLNERIGSLLSDLQQYVHLEDGDITNLGTLSSELESEFGDLSTNTNRIRNEFFQIYDQIPSQSPLKQYSRQFDSEYFENRNTKELEKLLIENAAYLQQWSTHFSKNVLPCLFRVLDGKIEDGGVKSLDSIRERIASGFADELNCIRDIIRGRFVGENLREVESAIQIIQSSLMANIVSILNTYHTLFIDRRNNDKFKPYLASNFGFRIDENLVYELQVMTKRASLIGKLDHPIRVKKQVELSPELKNYLDSLSWGSHLLDFREYLQGG